MEIQEIKQQLTIQTVLHHYGITPDKNNMAQCPFHNDKTPSFQIYPKSNTYCCFSSNCSAGTGDQIQFIELQEKHGKHQAILKAQELLGVQPENTNGIDKGESQKTSSAKPKPIEQEHDYEQIFTKLQQNIRKSPDAKQYIKKRNLTTDSLELGYNASGYRDLRNCIIFPLKDKHNKVVSMYGRSITNNGTAKHYYTKNRKGLYPGYPKPDTRKLILTESIIDAATLLQEESISQEYEVLALYGTNGLTPEHKGAIRNLKHLKEIVLWMDGDRAGEKAAEKYRESITQLTCGEQSRTINPKS
ncbi:MAG: toprim domain-containing protein [Flavobacteriales bacterium]|nr:toprim domain-containing protein [Flavobacteriales bacterium]